MPVAVLQSSYAGMQVAAASSSCTRPNIPPYPSTDPVPVNRCPDELLMYIFSFAADIDHSPTSEEQSHASFSDIFIPMNISHVCSRWNRIALSTPSLWSHIILTFPFYGSLDLQLDRVLAWIRRSRKCGLHIFIDVRDPLWGWSDEDSHRFGNEDMQRILDQLLLPTVQRWKSVEFLSDTRSPILTFHHAFANPSMTQSDSSRPPRMLQKLALSTCNAYLVRQEDVHYDPASINTAFPLFGGAELPSLVNVTLAGTQIDWRKSCLCRLTSLELKYQPLYASPPLQDFIRTLERCPDLQILTLIGWGVRFDEEVCTSRDIHGAIGDSFPPPPPLFLYKLKHLKFGFIDCLHAIRLLEALSFPSLRTLHLEDIRNALEPSSEDGWNDSSVLFTSLILRSWDPEVPSRMCSFPLHELEEMVLSRVSLSEETFDLLLSRMNRINSLALISLPTTIINVVIEDFIVSQNGVTRHHLSCPSRLTELFMLSSSALKPPSKAVRSTGQEQGKGLVVYVDDDHLLSLGQELLKVDSDLSSFAEHIQVLLVDLDA